MLTSVSPRLLLVMALLSVAAYSQATTLCLNCATLFNGYCVSCNTGGCAPYAQLDSASQCNCKAMYYLAQTTGGNPYCDRCFVGCKTCSGPESTSCLSCVTSFTHDSTTSTCTAPSTSNDYTIQNVYNFLGFGILTNWNWQTTSSSNLYGSSTTYTCNSETFVGVGRRQYLQGSFSGLQTHYEVRVMFAHYFLTNSATENIQIYRDGTTSNVPISTSLTGSNNPSFSCGPGSNVIKTMVDQSYTHSASTLTLRISTTDTSGNGYYWGIKEFILIIKLCNSACSSCNGYYSDNCTACSDPFRIATYTGYTGICKCYGSGGNTQLMYQEQSAYTCVFICPTIPVETFGNNVTRACVSQCPNNSYAYTDLYRCWADCPKTSIVSNQLLFKDKTYWRCVPNCPPEAPYANADDRTCYATCPNTTNTGGYLTDYFAVEGLNSRCVSVCPYNSTFQLFGYQAKCISLCPTGTWGDPITKLCLPDCDSGSLYPYKDNSSGQRICVQNCSYGDWFRDNQTWSCVQTCPANKYGQTNRQCVSMCSGGRFGIPFGNRKCVDYCPEGYWGQPDAAVCVDTAPQCKTTNNRYADNYTRTCVFPQSCSLGYFAENNSQMCQPTCVKASAPNNIVGASVGEPFSRLCQLQCNGSLYADYVAGLCVTNCITNDTYRDDYAATGKTCVLDCNLLSATPWRDNNTWTCVADCNNTGIVNLVRDNTTWMCVFQCPPNYYADFVTSTNPICRSVCLSGTYGDNSTGTGLCVEKCSTYPARFGDSTGGINICVAVCSVNLYGDETGNRLCTNYCPSGYFAQNDATRLCVRKCKPGTYGQNRWCNTDPFNCTANTFANDFNNLCDGCSAVQATWGDPTTKRCVTQCPLNSGIGPVTYYADISIRQCVLTCSNTYTTGATTTYSVALWGNNQTRTCVFVCNDLNAYVQPQTSNPYRVCVAKCHPTPAFHYANNQTKVCGPSIDCGFNHYGQNNTQTCLENCPSGSFGYQTASDKICIDICPLTWYGDSSSGVRLCVTLCPTVPSLFADPTTKLCLSSCPSGYYADPSTRRCVLACPYAVTVYYAYEPNRTCITVCPTNYFGKFSVENITGLPQDSNISRCVTPSSSCGASMWGDPYLHLCVALCSGPNPVALYGYWPDCVSQCPANYYANTYGGARICVQLCPPGVLGSTAAPDLYGDPSTISCVPSCVTPLTWADPQTRLCQSTCSATPVPSYSENFGFTCVTALNCPTTPKLTFGDNHTRSCVSNCSSGKYGDPTSRNCVTQCPNDTTTLTSTYYSDTSTGQYICVIICPSLPRLFGYNATNNCVSECPIPNYGDQTGNRTCVPTCPLIGVTVYFAQNTSRICVDVCQTGTWGYTASRQCVEVPTACQTQWADNTTNLCVTTCPATADTFGDPTTKFCVSLCPNTYFADYSTRLCVQTCPANVEEHGYFGNNYTRICQQVCASQNGTVTYADPQTANRFCVTACSQTPSTSFADPSTFRCVPVCPTFPSLFGETSTFTCVSSCAVNTYADTSTRLCVSTCPASYFKHKNPNLCVQTCPPDSTVPLYGDPSSGFCESTCTNSYYRYDTLSLCVASCQTYSLLAYNMTCVKFCPTGFYADSTGVCIASCPASTYGQNTTTTCLPTCLTGYADSNLCLAVCPNGKYGQNHVCVSSCQVAGNIASNLTNTCLSNCSNTTYSQGGQCVSSCSSGSYADSYTNQCSSSCTNSHYGDPTTNKCVTHCPSGYYKDATGYCVTACVAPKYADNVTWQCTDTCSTGYWGHNLLCKSICPSGTYGYLPDRICYSIANRPVSTPIYFADNDTQTWITQCPFSPLTFGDRTIRYCISNCYGSYFNDPQTRKCETNCQNSSYYADSTTNRCVMVCPSDYFSNSVNGKCQAVCTTGYAYAQERKCVATCPAPYSGYHDTGASVKSCVLRCPANLFSYQRVCYSSCSVAGYYADNSTNECVTSCHQSFASDDSKRCVSSCAGYATYPIADNSTNKCVAICPSTPDYYVENNVCVYKCSANKYADPTVGKRQCTSLCTTGLFSDPVSGRCMAYCPLGYWAQNTTNDCTQSCRSGSYADNVTGKCVAACPSPTYADPTTQRCVKLCPSGYFGEADLTCVPQCTLPLYGNPLNRRCQASCPAFDNLFAENTTAMCVSSCSVVANSYADRNNNICVSNCTRANEYMLDSQAICTNLCPLGLFMENSTKKCQATCTTGFAEPTTRYCVARCFGNPQTYGYLGVCHYKCLNGSHNLYADNSTSLCVGTCASTPQYFSDPLTGNCVLFCPEGYFAENTTRTCTPTCSVGYADNLTRKCVAVCPTTPTEWTYGQLNSHKCLRICPTNMFADNVTQECVIASNCSGVAWSDVKSKYCVARCPSEPLTFGLNSSTSCVSRCPDGFFGDYQSQTCLTSCPPAISGQYRFADPDSQTCVFVCPINNNLYGDTFISSNFSCVSTCSNNQLRDNSTQRCVSVCPSTPTYWADTNAGDCVYLCPTSYFASSEADRLCVPSCSVYLTYGDTNERICTSVCPFNHYADNSSYLCKTICPSNPDYYADNTTGTCVFNCPKTLNWVTFADPTSRQCVTQCPPGYFAINNTQRCDVACPLGQYQDPIIRVCVAECTVRPHWYKHTNGSCLYECPSMPMAYKLDNNHSCVYTDGNGYTGCPASYWANPLDFMCTTLCPYGFYADQTKHLCVTACPANEYADQFDRKCKTICSSAPEEYRLELTGVRTCTQYCPSLYFADNSTYNCVLQCPGTPTVMYAYQRERKCVITCPAPEYSYLPDRTCRTVCPTSYYAQDSSRSCQTGCLSPYFADNTTQKCILMCPSTPAMYGHSNVCVQYCPLGFYADNSTRMCVATCPTQPITFAENTTRQCVINCPSTPNSFADNTTMICVTGCPDGTFAEVTTRTCVLHCPSNIMTYADNTTNACQPTCPSPYYASDLTKQCVMLCPNTPVKTYALDNGRVCTSHCPSGLFGQNTTRICALNCTESVTSFKDTNLNMCVSTCSPGWFARNDTLECVRNCPSGTYADNSTRICMDACPGVLKHYADNSTWTCVTQCPVGTYGNNQNWTCIDSCPLATSGYRLDISNTCVEQCPSPYFAFEVTRTCVLNCGAGKYGDSATRICNDCDPKCPTCLSLTYCLTCTTTPLLYLSFGVCLPTCPTGTFADNATMTCVYATNCPSGLYGSTTTMECIATCPVKQYPNTTTKMCTNCPSTCASCTGDVVCTSCITTAAFSNITNLCYAFCSATQQYSFNGACFDNCPAGSYLDYTNVYCQRCNSACLTCSVIATNCTSCSTTYLYNFSCVAQCPSGYYPANAECLICTANIPSCSKPLTFETTTRTQNYQSVIYLRFSEKVNIQGNPNDLLTLNLKLNRRLQSTASMVNNGLSYTATVMADGTIRIVLSPQVSLTNPSFTVTINDPNRITTSSGATLASLEAQVTDVVLNSYPPGSTSDAPMVVAGTVLSILMLIVVGAIFLCSAVPVYHSLQAFQMISLYAFITDLPPNFFYFLKQLRLSRLDFLPNIFADAYQEPPGYVAQIPEKIIEIDGQLSFSLNAGSYMFIFFIYLFIGLLIYIASRKYNNNRPLRQMVEKVYNTRVKWGLVWDLLWLFALNIYFCGFVQFKYTVNGGDTAIAIISLLATISLPTVAFIYRAKRYGDQDENDAQNFKLVHEGLKDGKEQYFAYVFFLRKIVFAAIVAGSVGGSSRVQASLLMTVSIIMLLFLIIFRPFQQKLRNVMHILNQIGLTALAIGCIYYRNYMDAQEPVGTKILCGQILTIGMIIHLSLAIIWALFRSYYFYQQTKEQFTKTEFFTLYLDEKYDENLEKQLQELNDETGTVESVEVITKESQVSEQLGEDDEIIKLKIRRRRKIQKNNRDNKPEKEQQLKKPNIKRNNKDYVKIDEQNQGQFEFPYAMKKQPEFEPVIFEKEQPQYDNEQVTDNKDEWAELKNPSEAVSNVLQASPKVSDHHSPRQNTQAAENILMSVKAGDPFPIADISQISSVSNKEEAMSKEEGQNLKQSLSHMEPPIKEEQPYELEDLDQEEPPAEKPKAAEQLEGPQLSQNKDQSEVVQQEQKKPAEEDQWERMSKWQELKSEQTVKYKQPPEEKHVIDLDDLPQEEEKPQEEKPKANPAWNMEVEDLLDEEQKKEKEDKPRMNLLMFDPEDFE